jgi:hypothetical protein
MTTMLNAMMNSVGLFNPHPPRAGQSFGMFWGRVKRALIIGLAATSLGLSGCAMVRLGYANADELAYRWLDGWLDFNDAQSAQARTVLTEVHDWHRKTQLPDYAQWLAKTADDMLKDTTPEAVCKLSQDFVQRMGLMAEKAAPGSSLIAVTLSDEQLDHMQKRFERSQKKFRDDYSQPDAKQREASALERSISRAESLYGKVDARQREVLAQAAKDSPFDAKLQLVEREVRQRELMQILRAGKAAAQSGNKEEAAKQMLAAFKKWEEGGRKSPRADYAAYQKRVSDYNCATSAKVHNVALPATRQAARDKLKGWEADLRAMAGG